MRYLFVVGLLVTLMAMRAVVLAQAHSALTVSGTASSGVLSGPATIAGVTGTITSSSGSWTMTVGSVTFTSGTYTCGGGSCTYTGTVAGSTRHFSFSINTTTNAITAATGFPTHGAWVSTVAHWGAGNRAALGGNIGHTGSSAAWDPANTVSNGGGRISSPAQVHRRKLPASSVQPSNFFFKP
jgi:hypothetical protein